MHKEFFISQDYQVILQTATATSYLLSKNVYFKESEQQITEHNFQISLLDQCILYYYSKANYSFEVQYFF